MPGTKDPSGKTTAATGLIVEDLKFDPPQPAAATLKGTLGFADTPVATRDAMFGKCKVTLTSDASSPNALSLALQEPGCDVATIAKAPMGSPFEATAKGNWLGGGTPQPIEVQFELARGEKTFDEVVKEKAKAKK